MSETPEADDGPEVASADPAPTAQESERALDSAGFDTLLDYLKRARGFDFTAYKRGSLMRRVRRRMQTVAIEDFTRYTDYLEVHPGEFAQLFNTILINVTSFFRDPTAWEYVSQEVIPRILASKGEAGAIRVWSAGCASGEEAYTLAMLLAEHLGHDVFRQRVKIYATDVDEDALNKARHAAYSEKDLESVPAALREKYFGADKGRISFDRALRRNVIFGRHDLLSDPPISRVDLLVCRNTLMYFNTEGQTRILSRFYQALNPDGYLFLGRAEMLIGHANLFAPLELNKRVFIPVSKAGLRDKLVTMAQNGRQEARDHWMTHAHIRDAAVDMDPVPSLVIDLAGKLVVVTERARAIFRVSAADVGRPLDDLAVSYQPTELRGLIEQAVADRRPALRRDVTWNTASGDARSYDVHVLPLIDNAGRLLGSKIVFVDISRYHRLQEELHTAKQELETAYEELQSSNEELETTNEELQSSNEELETTNEELQSANEELETMNEELQSTNVELETVNSQLRELSADTERTNGLLTSILGSLRCAVVVLNRELDVLVWNAYAEELWGLRAAEVEGRNFLKLDIGLPVAKLRAALGACLTGENDHQVTTLEAVNRRGQKMECHVTCSPLKNGGAPAKAGGVILLIDETREKT